MSNEHDSKDFRKKRIEILKRNKNLCEICQNDKISHVRRIKENGNNNIDNLIGLCKKCSGSVGQTRMSKKQKLAFLLDNYNCQPKKEMNQSKYKRLYGLNMSDMAFVTGYGESTICKILKRNDNDKKKIDFLNYLTSLKLVK